VRSSAGRLEGGPAPDLRLLIPAGAAWATTAGTLGSTTGTRLGLSAALLVAALALVSAQRPGAAARRGPVWGLAALTAATCSLALLASGAHQAVREAGPLHELAAQRSTVVVTGTVSREPVVRSGRGGETVVLAIAVKAVRARGATTQVAAPVLVVADERWRAVRWRETVQARGRLAAAGPAEASVAVLRPSAAPESLARPGPVARAADHLRAGLRRAAEPLPPDARGLLPALVIGDTTGTPEDLTEAMLVTGMTHLSAVSGSNVAIVLAVAMGLAAMVGLRRPLRPVWALAVLAGFVVLARPEPSVIRAATMGAIGIIGLSRSRRAAGLPVLSAAVVLLLVVDPWLSRTYGFALSTLATLGLLLFTRAWGRAIGRRLPQRISSWGPALAIPVAAQLMCAPVVVLLQGSVSTVGVLANLVAAPFVAPATVAGVGAALIAPVSQTAATGLCWLGALPTLAIAQAARVFARVPGGLLPWPDGPPGALLLAVLTVLGLATGAWAAHQARVRPTVVAAAVLLVVAAATPTSAVTWPPEQWRLVACDVGQGDALVVASAPGRAVVVDTGPDPVVLDRCLGRLGVDALDAVVLTHFHADHVQGLPGALRGRPVREILTTPVTDVPHQHRQVQQWAADRGIPVRDLHAGDALVWEQASARVWWPGRQVAGGSAANNASVVLEVHAGPVDALLLGDVEREAARAILLALRRDPAMAAAAGSLDAVKTPHHGSANLDAELMAAVRAPIAIVSVGKDNDYGHPAPSHLQVLRRNGYAVFRTDQRGDIALVDTGGEVGVTWRAR
jgi:competence protein ComEC